MILRSACSVLALGLIAVMAVTPADAAKKKKRFVRAVPVVTGLAASHDLRMEGNRICFSDHYHYGSSMGGKTKRAAEIEAIKSWAGFVAFEYGNDWANFAKSGSKSMKCNAPYQGSWSCDLSARPCK